MDYVGNDESVNSPELAIPIALVMTSAEKLLLIVEYARGEV